MSISQATQQVIEEVVEEQLSDESVFTALNISREVQKRGIRERHCNMRDHIHNSIGNLNVYHVKTLVNMKDGNQVFVYHMPCDDPIDFLDNITVGKNNSNPASSQGSTQTSAKTPAQAASPASTQASGTVSPDNRGRVCISASDLRSIGLEPGDKVSVSSHPSVDLVKVSSYSSGSGKLYVVDRSGNVRIARRVLDSAGIADANVTVSVIGNNIAVEG